MPALNIDSIDDALLFERQESFAGGEDDYRRSTLIDPEQCQKLVNIIVRDNYEAWTRPGADPFTAQVAAFPIRSLAYFDTPANKYLLAVCNGGLQACGGAGQSWSSVAYTAADSNRYVELAQGVDTMLISDGVNAMATLDGNLTVTTCGTDANLDPPVGANILCFHAGRMFASGFAGGTTGKEREAIWVSNRLAFGTGQWNGTTRSFRIGVGDGDPVTALHPLQSSILAVFKQNSIWLANTSPTSEPTDFQASTVTESLSFGVGCVGKRALCGVANDVFFMAQDGVRSLQRMQAASGQWQLSAPISQPVQQYINRINVNARQYIVATNFQEFVFFAVPLDSSTVNNATLVYNTRIGRWLGCWTGWTPTAFALSRFSDVQQLQFADSLGYVNVWKNDKDTNNAATYKDNGQIIPCSIWTRAYQFGEPINPKNAYNTTLFFTAGETSASITAVFDLADAKRFDATFQNAGDRLGFGHLGPFLLASVKPKKVTKSLRSLPRFNEMYLKIETTSGWIKLRNITVAAFPAALQN